MRYSSQNTSGSFYLFVQGTISICLRNSPMLPHFLWLRCLRIWRTPTLSEGCRLMLFPTPQLPKEERIHHKRYSVKFYITNRVCIFSTRPTWALNGISGQNLSDFIRARYTERTRKQKQSFDLCQHAMWISLRKFMIPIYVRRRIRIRACSVHRSHLMVDLRLPGLSLTE